MKKIANVQEMTPGEYINFAYEGGEAILIKTPHGKLVAYSIVCPHEGGTIEWDAEIQKLICGCHLSLFNVEDGSVYKHSSIYETIGDLTPLALNIDEKEDIYIM